MNSYLNASIISSLMHGFVFWPQKQNCTCEEAMKKHFAFRLQLFMQLQRLLKWLFSQKLAYIVWRVCYELACTFILHRLNLKSIYLMFYSFKSSPKQGNRDIAHSQTLNLRWVREEHFLISPIVFSICSSICFSGWVAGPGYGTGDDWVIIKPIFSKCVVRLFIPCTADSAD